MTVLFADVVHSMDIAAAVGAERLREIMTELVERSAAVVQRYGGTVDYTGDGVMALFGAPVALEDHAFRACLAALAASRITIALPNNWISVPSPLDKPRSAEPCVTTPTGEMERQRTWSTSSVSVSG